MVIVDPDPDFLYKPLLAEEPFDLGPAERHELAPLAEELGARFLQQTANSVQPEEHTVELVRLTVVTPEEAPLAIFGPPASEAVAELLSARGIEVELEVHAREGAGRELILAPGDGRLLADEVVALPAMDGPALAGLPHDERGSIPVDEDARVVGADVYAAGDGTDFPIKQGGSLARLPLVAPHKISGRYLAPFLHHDEANAEPEPPRRPLEVEVDLPNEWHERPR